MTNTQKFEWQLHSNAVQVEFEDSEEANQTRGGLIIRTIEFSEKSPSDALLALPTNYRCSNQVVLANLNKNINLKDLKNNPAGPRLSSLRIEGGELTDVQLNDLVQTFPYLFLAGVDFIDTGQTKVNSGVTQALYVESMNPGEAGQLLDVYENASWLHIYDCDFDPADWNATVLFARKNGSYIKNVRLPAGFLDTWRPKT